MSQLTFAAFSLLALFQALAVLGQGMLAPRHVDVRSAEDAAIHYAQSLGGNIPDGIKQKLLGFKYGKYPTDFTRGIVPKQLHSHNDYWRDVPLYSALSVGAISVEADVWLKDDTLYVGHEESALSKNRTFENLYVNPLLDILKHMNPTTDFINGKYTSNGVFDTDSAQTLYLWIDCKTNGARTFAKANELLHPLRKAGYLTTYSDKAGVFPGAVTVIGTGNTPLNAVQGVSPRAWFYDAQLLDLAKGRKFENLTADVTPIASTDFLAAGFEKVGRRRGPVFDEDEIDLLKKQIKVAADKGIGARYWDTPGWPVRTRKAVWKAVWENGAMLVNVDDLYDAAFGDW